MWWLEIFRELFRLPYQLVNGSIKAECQKINEITVVKGEPKSWWPPLWLIVGVNVPNALWWSLKCKRFGYHSYISLRKSRESAEQSYCVLKSQVWIVQRISRVRLDTMVRTNDGLWDRGVDWDCGTRRIWWETQQSDYKFIELLTWVKTPPILTLAEGWPAPAGYWQWSNFKPFRKRSI